MKITEKQLDEYIALYKQEYGEQLERVRASAQLQDLLLLGLYLAFPEETVTQLETVLGKEYNKNAVLKEEINPTKI